MAVKIKRAYGPPLPRDGFRILVDRLWPRGISKGKAKIGLWLKEIAPSDSLRKWFAHDEKKWLGFQRKYRGELKSKRLLLDKLKQLEKEKKTITLLFAAKDEKRNNAAVLAELLSRANQLPPRRLLSVNPRRQVIDELRVLDNILYFHGRV